MTSFEESPAVSGNELVLQKRNSSPSIGMHMIRY